MRIAHINTATQSAAGRMATDLCRMARKAGHQSLLCYSHGPVPVDIPSLRIGDTPDVTDGLPARRSGAPVRIHRKLTRRLHQLSTSAGMALHAGLSRLTDRSGFYSRAATQRFIQQLKRFSPDLIHLHTLHGDSLNLPTLFDYLQSSKIPVVWTLHDAWAFTGHCASYHYAIPPFSTPAQTPDPAAPAQCLLWQKRCNHCPLLKSYPASWWKDQSARNFTEKKDLFTALPRLTLTTPSQWLHQEATRSFLGSCPIRTLPGGIDLTQYAPCADERRMQDIALFYGLDQLDGRRMLLNVSYSEDRRHELEHLMALADTLGDDYCVAVAGLNQTQIESLPEHMLGLPVIANTNDLCVLYTVADCCVSLKQGEPFGRELLEAMACGTQVLGYRTAALPEIVPPQVGELVPVGDITAAADAVRRLCDEPKDPLFCIAQAARYGSNLRYEAYLQLYHQLTRTGA